MKQQINLYLAEFPPPKKIKIPFKYVLILTLVLGGGGAAGSLGYLEIEANKEQLAVEISLLKTAKKNVAKLKSLQKNSSGDRIKLELIALQDVIKRKKLMASSVKEQTSFAADGFSERYIALGRQDVRGLWLNSIEFDSDEARVSLHGATINAALLTNYLDQLSKEPSFNGVSFRVMVLDEPGSNEEGAIKQKSEYLNFIVSTHETAGNTSQLRASLR